MTSILPWQYPTTVVILDDNRYFLESVEFILPKGHRFIFATDPRKIINLACESEKLSQKLTNMNLQDYRSSFNGKKAYKFIENPKRSHEISTIFVDYHMPAMNGLELCEKLKDYACQKILFTAGSDESIAIKAFNKGLIHGYICKQDPHVEKHLNEALLNSTVKHFRNKFINTFPLDERRNLPFLREDIQDFLKDYIATNNIVEHYMIDCNGSSICINNNGIARRIVIKNRKEIQIPLTLGESEKLPKAIIDDIKSCRKMFYVSIEELHSLPVNEWNNLLANAYLLNERSNFFTAIVENQSLPYSAIDVLPFFMDDF